MLIQSTSISSQVLNHSAFRGSRKFSLQTKTKYFQTSEKTKESVEDTAERLQDVKNKIDEMLEADRATAQEIEQIVQGKSGDRADSTW